MVSYPHARCFAVHGNSRAQMSFVSWTDSVPLEGGAAAGRRVRTASLVTR